MQLDADKLFDTLAENIGTLPRETAIVGIHTGGAWVARALRQKLGGVHEIGNIAVTLHRDDFSARGLHPSKQTSDISFSVDGRNILLVDDVLSSGRTVRAALNELFDFGRPASVKLAVLIDRGDRQMPFAPDYVAMTMALNADQTLVLTDDNNQLRFDVRDRESC